GPKRFFFFNLFESDVTGAPLAVFGRSVGSVDAYAAAVGRWLVTRDGFDFLVHYLPDYDFASHLAGPGAAEEALLRSDAAIRLFCLSPPRSSGPGRRFATRTRATYSSPPLTASSSPISRAAATWAAAATAPSPRPIPRCRCSRSASLRRRGALPISRRLRSSTSASSRRPTPAASRMPPEDEQAHRRHAMVAAQLRGRDIVDERVLRAMEAVPRERFVGERQQRRAYDDAA